MDWDWAYTADLMPELLKGFVTSITATVIGAVIAIGLGFLFAFARYEGPAIVGRLVGIIVDFLRGTPLLVQLYFLFFVLPEIGVKLSPLTTGIVGLGLSFSGYTSEVFRARLLEFSTSQLEASLALGIPKVNYWINIVIPQVSRLSVPAIGSYILLMFKESALLSTITVVEVLKVATNVGQDTFRYVEPLTMTAFLFWCVSYPAAVGIRKLEKRRSKVTVA